MSPERFVKDLFGPYICAIAEEEGFHSFLFRRVGMKLGTVDSLRRINTDDSFDFVVRKQFRVKALRRRRKGLNTVRFSNKVTRASCNVCLWRLGTGQSIL
jgi:hypothetical protein